jgi:hypothetical protein
VEVLILKGLDEIGYRISYVYDETISGFELFFPGFSLVLLQGKAFSSWNKSGASGCPGEVP